MVDKTDTDHTFCQRVEYNGSIKIIHGQYIYSQLKMIKKFQMFSVDAKDMLFLFRLCTWLLYKVPVTDRL